MNAPSPHANRPGAAAALATAFFVALVLALLCHRAGRQLSFDGYHYVELAKQFALVWPDRFGNHWPFGWPLAGGLLGRAGLSAFPALLLLSAASLLALLALAARPLADHPLRFPVLCALGAAPVVATQLGAVLTELPFAAALLGLACALARTPAPRAWWAAAACVLLALSLRYAGVIALGVLGAWTLFQWRQLPRASRLHAASATAFALAACLGLLLWNHVVSGSASGAGRGPSDGLAGLWPHLCDLGWSLPSALLADGARGVLPPGGLAYALVGAALFAAPLTVCLLGFLAPRERHDRPLALVAAAYLAGMVVLRCIGHFDALYNSRTFLPAFAPLLLLLASRLRERPRLLAPALAALIAIGFASATRGISRQIAGDIAPAIPFLATHAAADDLVAINDHAFTVSAHLRNRTTRVWPILDPQNFDAPWLVVAGEPLDRAGTPSPLPEDWRATAAKLVATGRYHTLLDTPALLVLARSDRAAP